MASQNTSTPAKVPASAASYSAATLDPELRSQINCVLIKDGAVSKIQEHLLHSLNANSSNWPTAVQNHALSLLRSGEVSTFPALLRRVIEDVRHENALNPSSGINVTNGTSTEVNGKKSSTNGSGGTPSAGGADGGSSNGTSSTTAGLAVPQTVIEDALRVTRESLEMVCEIDESGATGQTTS
ncbi:hypothetical protein QBC47DRAFT_391353 [Echria macrotheca]|uniref:Uncharacterized protein n=1 Tax=Echria macrotheca TaxID=438768 RepID=A0AAJ0B9M4_9PEZI|nr:hypothetical protein QBC47DRAFT_391353 [Echria macrotheca]